MLFYIFTPSYSQFLSPYIVFASEEPSEIIVNLQGWQHQLNTLLWHQSNIRAVMLQWSISYNGEIPVQLTSVVFTNLWESVFLPNIRYRKASLFRQQPMNMKRNTVMLGLYSLWANAGQQLTRWSIVSSAKPQSLHLAELWLW